MAAWLLPAFMSLISAGGQIATNRANREMAREQMRFQERMSNTSAQRSVQDYRDAGLNPALAYERGASTPGGATAVMGDVAGTAVSSAKDAARLAQELRQAREQHVENLRLTRANTDKIAKEGMLIEAQQRREDTTNRFMTLAQPHQLRQIAADAMLAQLALPAARNTASFEEMLGKGSPGLHSAKTAAEILKLITARPLRR